jgi:hypothetical protein
MFDFINRAASITDPAVVSGLDELIPHGSWRVKLEEAERQTGGLTPDARKAILVDAFSASLAQLGKYEYVAETTVLRPLRDRPLYCLFYATRHSMGIEVFRDSQIKALKEQSSARATAKVKHAQAKTGQAEIFQSLHDMGPDELTAFLQGEQSNAEKALLDLVPTPPGTIEYGSLRAQVLTRHVVTAPDVNSIGARLRKDGKLLFPDWEQGRRVPQPSYRVTRAAGTLDFKLS